MKQLWSGKGSPPVCRGGFTLVEVMVATFLFALVMTAVITTMMTAGRMGQSARNRLDALHHARASMEELYGSSFTDSDLQAGTHTLSRGGLTGGYTVTDLTPGPMKRVELFYTYASFGRTARVELEGRISDALR
jgi:prepilin-type N-terminal cleavage/methylation domain-containing protein